MSKPKNEMVSKAEYEKLLAENNSLRKDIEILLSNSSELTMQKMDIRSKWREHFRKNREIVNEVRQMVGERIKTADGYDVNLNCYCWFPYLESRSSGSIWVPKRDTAKKILNNEEKCFGIRKNCQKYCDDCNSIVF